MEGNDKGNWTEETEKEWSGGKMRDGKRKGRESQHGQMKGYLGGMPENNHLPDWS